AGAARESPRTTGTGRATPPPAPPQSPAPGTGAPDAGGGPPPPKTSHLDGIGNDEASVVYGGRPLGKCWQEFARHARGRVQGRRPRRLWALQAHLEARGGRPWALGGARHAGAVGGRLGVEGHHQVQGVAVRGQARHAGQHHAPVVRGGACHAGLDLTLQPARHLHTAHP
ncbi:unnamed protein product, partial [Ixodes persulcatus]